MMKTRDSKIIELYKSGLSIRKVADQCSIGPSTVNRALKKHGIGRDLEQAWKTRGGTKDVDTNKVIEDYKSGKAVSLISNENNVSRNKITRILKNNNIEIRDQKTAFKTQKVKVFDQSLCNDDLSVKNIMTTHNVSKSTAVKWRKSIGVSGEPVNKMNLPIEEIINKHVNNKKSATEIAKHYNVYYGTIIKRLGDKYNPNYKSGVQNQIMELLDEHCIEYIQNTRKIITPLELDFYLPQFNLAIEVNGIYWHTENHGNKDKKYHITKTIECNKQCIDLIHIWDSEINLKWEIVKSRILNKIGKSDKIYARKCKISQVDSNIAREFFRNNHIDGYIRSGLNFALIYEDEIVSMMNFSKARFTEVDYELLRFANKTGTSVIGGASRLFKHFTRNYNGSIVSYADRRWSGSNVFYEKLGFKFSHLSDPGYKYTKDYIYLESRNKYQKHKLEKLSTFDPDLTEWQNMQLAGYDRIWDCGNFVFLYGV